eukprot:4617958-Prymnesium_polylepis.1
MLDSPSFGAGGGGMRDSGMGDSGAHAPGLQGLIAATETLNSDKWSGRTAMSQVWWPAPPPQPPTHTPSQCASGRVV